MIGGNDGTRMELQAQCSNQSLPNLKAQLDILLTIEILSITFRTLNYGNDGIFLIVGNAGSVSSTVVGV